MDAQSEEENLRSFLQKKWWKKSEQRFIDSGKLVSSFFDRVKYEWLCQWHILGMANLISQPSAKEQSE